MKIVLGMDFSAGAEAAADELTLRPWPAGTTVNVVSVVDAGSAPPFPGVGEEVARRVEEMAQRAAERLTSAGLPARATVVSGDPKTELVEQARADGADLIIVGPHSSGIVGFLLGSVAKAVLRMAPCSVEVARPRSAEHRGSGGLRVLLATDGSELSAAAAQWVASRSWPAGTEVRVLSAVELQVPMVQTAFEPPFIETKAIEEMRMHALERAQAAIASTRETLTEAGLATSESLSVLWADAKEIIVNEARGWKADVVVVGSHGRRGFDRLMLGSVSEAVAMHAHCSVDVIRIKQGA